MLYDGFGQEFHTVFRFGASTIVVFATTADVVFVGASKKIQTPKLSSTLAWEPLGPKDRGLHCHPLASYSSFWCGVQTKNTLRDRTDNLAKRGELYKQAPGH